MHSLHLHSTLPIIILFVSPHDSTLPAVQMRRRWLEMVVANSLPYQEGVMLAFTPPQSLLWWSRQTDCLSSALAPDYVCLGFTAPDNGIWLLLYRVASLQCPGSLPFFSCSSGLDFRDTVFLRLYLLRANPVLLVQLGSCRS